MDLFSDKTLCWKCGKPITNDNWSREHIFLESLGGTNSFSSYELLHAKCNSEFGENLDKAISSQLGIIPFMLGLDVGKNSKVDQAVEINDFEGEKYFYGFGLKGKLTVVLEYESGRLLTIHGNDIVEIKKNIEYVAKKQKWKGDYKTQIENLVFQNSKPAGGKVIWPIMNYGGKDFLHQCTKTAINFARLHGIPLTYMELAIDSVLNYEVEDPRAFFYKILPVPIKYAYDEVSHTIHLVGDSAKKTLSCLISIYGLYEVGVLLNGNYTGPFIKQTYSYDLLKSTPINDREVKFINDKEAILKQLNSRTTISKNADENVQRMIRIIESRQGF